MKTLHILLFLPPSEELRVPLWLGSALLVKKGQDCDLIKVMEQVIARTGREKREII